MLSFTRSSSALLFKSHLFHLFFVDIHLVGLFVVVFFFFY